MKMILLIGTLLSFTSAYAKNCELTLFASADGTKDQVKPTLIIDTDDWKECFQKAYEYATNFKFKTTLTYTSAWQGGEFTEDAYLFVKWDYKSSFLKKNSGQVNTNTHKFFKVEQEGNQVYDEHGYRIKL